jgi:hypothetical protein
MIPSHTTPSQESQVDPHKRLTRFAKTASWTIQLRLNQRQIAENVVARLRREYE